MVKLKLLSSLAKVFADEEPLEYLETGRFSGFQNEVISFQLALGNMRQGWHAGDFIFTVESPLLPITRQYLVQQVPVGLAAFTDADKNYLRSQPGLFPDLLTVYDSSPIRIHAGHWQSIWLDISPSADTAAGSYPIKFLVQDSQGQLLASRETEVEILAGFLPEQKLRYTQWFHTDCLAHYYGLEVFSDQHWAVIENFMRMATQHGLNMILTPIFTPPLDTKVGGERLTTQLVDVNLTGGLYSFDFTKLAKWVRLAQDCGYKYFEMAHLFTQWGAKFAPKIMASVDGQYQQLFGWQTKATSPAYKEFLASFLVKLTEELVRLGIDKLTYFHISDEPALEFLDDYRAAKALVEPYIKGYPIIDALSSFEFYQTGALTKPIPGNNHMEPFLEAQVPGLWTYYCISQYREVSNQFIAMPSARNRILAAQLYKYDIEGFLHWGYNYYNNQYSTKSVNPYATTDAEGFVPGGDAFTVYPGAQGQPEPSIRLKVKRQALEDLRAFQLLESLTSKDYVLGLMEAGLAGPLTFSSYPKSDFYILDLRRRVNQAILQHQAAASSQLS